MVPTDSFYRVGVSEVEAAVSFIPGSVEKRMRAWATLHHPCCYMCGAPLDFEMSDPVEEYTCGTYMAAQLPKEDQMPLFRYPSTDNLLGARLESLIACLC